jgi:two-component system OmpR family sensor kinase
MTVAFALAMTLLLAAMGVFVYERQESNLDEIVNTSLRSRSDDVAALVRSSDTSRSVVGGRRLVESDEGFIQILTLDGRLLDGTTEDRTPVLRPQEARQSAREPLLFERHVVGVDGPARILARPVRAQGRIRVVVTGSSLSDREDSLTALSRSFLIGGPIAVLLASGVGYLLATIGFRPVEAMRRRAKRISLDRHGERLPLPTAHDEIRRLGETLNEMLARLENSFDRERQFVADASHELRTPLAVVKAELEAALRAEGNGLNVRESLVAALEETDHLAQLAEDLLLIARAADGKLPVRTEDVEVRELLERTQHRFADRAREQGREITVDAAADLHAAVDPLRSRQALGNLVDNALRYGAGQIRISARRQNGLLQIAVSDAGEGFPPELAPHAFERFARGDGARARSGTGIGLSIVRAIAEAHGGTAVIVDTPSGGATVQLSVPVDDSHLNLMNRGQD